MQLIDLATEVTDSNDQTLSAKRMYDGGVLLVVDKSWIDSLTDHALFSRDQLRLTAAQVVTLRDYLNYDI